MSEIPGFARAQRAWENMEPDGPCECSDAEVWVCDSCGYWAENPGTCPEGCQTDEDEDVARALLPGTYEQKCELVPQCSFHRSCGGCGDCPECGNIGDPDD